jgi:aminoglycoside/choline kinase family phosphotransferase
MTTEGAGDASGAELFASGALEGLSLSPRDSLVPLAGHASSRRYFRVRASAAQSWVLAVYPEDGAVDVDRYVRASSWFGSAGVRVPRIVERGVRSLLLEDCGDLLLSDIRDVPDAEHLRLYRQAMAHLQHLGAARGLPDEVNPEWALDAERLRRELAFTEEHAIGGWLGGGGDRRAREAGFDALAEIIAGLPTVLCHRDYHARNLLLRGDRLVVIDFQDVMRGPVFYDSASLLWDNYCNVDPQIVTALLAESWRSGRPVTLQGTDRAAVPAVPSGLPGTARQAFCLVAAQRHLKALGTFGFQVTRGGNASFGRFGARTWRHARRALRELGWAELERALAPMNQLLA